MDNDQLFDSLMKACNKAASLESYLSWVMDELKRSDERVWPDKELAEGIRVFLMGIEDEKI
jgi:hypothetical protein